MVAIFLTGAAGVGKTTVFNKAVALLRASGLSVGGFTTPEVRRGGERIGFKVVDLATGCEGWLATRSAPGVRFANYYVKVGEFEAVALPALSHALESCNVVAVDELGRMEFFSRRFSQALKKVLASEKPLLATLHRSLVENFSAYGEVIKVTRENRATLPREIVEKILKQVIRQ